MTAKPPAKPKVTRKVLQFQDNETDQRLLDAIATELAQKQYASFNHLCKAALHQFLLSREPTQSVILFMELERSLAQLQGQVDNLLTERDQTLERLSHLEARLGGGDLAGATSASVSEAGHGSVDDTPDSTPDNAPDQEPPAEKDPLLEHFSALLEEF